jgi:uncharacterized membrane protein
MSVSHLLKISRLEGLTDGIFAIAMTIMILNLHVPDHVATTNILPLIKSDIYANLFIYVGSFIILGTHWIAMNFQLGLLSHLNRIYLWTNIFYLMLICVVPFSANLLGEYPFSADSINFYVVNLLGASLGQLLTLECARYFKLYREEFSAAIYRATARRILVAPMFYVTSLFVAHWNIRLAFILLVLPTLIYMIPGRIDRYETRVQTRSATPRFSHDLLNTSNGVL